MKLYPSKFFLCTVFALSLLVNLSGFSWCAEKNLLKDINQAPGTVAGTVRLEDVNDLPQGSYPPEAVELSNGLRVFSACDEANGCELWASDGTESGTYLLRRPGERLHGSGSPCTRRRATFDRSSQQRAQRFESLNSGWRWGIVIAIPRQEFQ